MKKATFFILLLSFISISGYAYSKEKKTVVLSIEDVLFHAKDNDLELKGGHFSLRELTKSKKNIYRSFFPAISTTIGSSRILNPGEADTRSYQFNITLEQMLYDQLSSPLMFKTFGISLEESKLKIMKREKDVEQKAVNLCLGVLLGEERLKNKNEEYGLYGRLLELMRAEYRVGMKTMLDVIDTETDLLETELGLEELSAQQLILEKDLINMTGLESSNYQIELNSSADYILSSLFNLNDAVSFEDLYTYLLSMEDKIEDIDALYTIALRNDFGVKKMKLSLMQNRVKQKLLSIQFLENISLSYGIDFTGERFFPANTSHTFAVNLLLDFGIVSSDIKVTESSSEGFKAGSQSAESEVLESLDPMDEGKYLRLESYTIRKKLEATEKEIRKNLEVWSIKMNSLLKTYTIKLKQRDSFNKNEELLKIKLQIGEIKEIDYMDFLIKKNEFLIELEEIKYNFIALIWEFEDLLNMKAAEILGT